MEMQKSGELQKHWDNFQAQEYTASMVSYQRHMQLRHKAPLEIPAHGQHSIAELLWLRNAGRGLMDTAGSCVMALFVSFVAIVNAPMHLSARAPAGDRYGADQLRGLALAVEVLAMQKALVAFVAMLMYLLRTKNDCC